VKNSPRLEDGIGDSLSQKLSRKLNGKPVYLSWSHGTASFDSDLVFKLEKSLFAEIAKNPDKF
jgi:hypothetical protein